MNAMHRKHADHNHMVYQLHRMVGNNAREKQCMRCQCTFDVSNRHVLSCIIYTLRTSNLIVSFHMNNMNNYYEAMIARTQCTTLTCLLETLSTSQLHHCSRTQATHWDAHHGSCTAPEYSLHQTQAHMDDPKIEAGIKPEEHWQGHVQWCWSCHYHATLVAYTDIPWLI